MPVIQHSELANHLPEVLRRAERGEQFTVTVHGRPVAHVGPAKRKQWVSRPELATIWQTPAPQTLATDLEHFPTEPADPPVT